MTEKISIINRQGPVAIKIGDRDMGDKEIVESLISRDEGVTRIFFWEKCRPLFCYIIYSVFHHSIDASADVHEDDYYNEVVNMVYEYLMRPGKISKDDAHNLRTFAYRSSLFSWIKIIALRLVIKRKAQVIENISSETPIVNEDTDDEISVDRKEAEEEVKEIFHLMLYDDSGKKKKGVALDAAQKRINVIKRLVLDEEEPSEVARSLKVTVANLYNIKKRAMADFAKAAQKERKTR